MAKTKEELNTIKEEVETLNEKLRELTDEELAQVTGGQDPKWITLFISAAPSLGFLGSVFDEELN